MGLQNDLKREVYEDFETQSFGNQQHFFSNIKVEKLNFDHKIHFNRQLCAVDQTPQT